MRGAAENAEGVRWFGEGNLSAARAAFERAVAADPGRSEPYVNLGTVLERDGDLDGAHAAFARAAELDPRAAAAHIALGRIALRRGDAPGAITSYERALGVSDDPQAHLALYDAHQVDGNLERALAHQRAALRHGRVFRHAQAQRGEPTVLVVYTEGPWDANVPVELLLDRTPFGVVRWYIDPAAAAPPALPAFDVVFNAIAESSAALAALDRAAVLLPALGRPIVDDPRIVRALLRRDALARALADLPHAIVPAARVVPRDAVATDPAIVASATAPVLVRPLDAHAGRGLVRIASPAEIEPYLAEYGAASAFVVTPFVDVRGPDGAYRKYRLICIDGTWYPFHLAVGDHWMLHYYNARNDEDPAARAEEEHFLRDLTGSLPAPARAALDALAAIVPLEYFGIDCGIAPDGRLVVFEVDVAMVVHLADDPQRYAYKHRLVAPLFDAFAAMIRARAARSA